MHKLIKLVVSFLVVEISTNYIYAYESGDLW